VTVTYKEVRMTKRSVRRIGLASVGVLAMMVPLASCAAGDSGDGTVEITYLMENQEPAYGTAEAMVKAFEAKNPDIKVTIESRPGGTEGDNLIKTKLSTQEMEDVFVYNTGSLLQALNPDQTLTPLADEAWVDDLDENMKTVVSTDNGLYGAPFGATQAGAVLYNIPLYEELGLEVPTSWEEFASNNDAIKAAGKTAVIQTYGDTWTSQLFILGDFGNIFAQDENWAKEYTAGERKYADEPALQGLLNQQEGFEAGWWNEDFASATLDDGLRMVATGEGAHYPIVTSTFATVLQNNPENAEDVGVFPLPAQDAEDTRLTIWLPAAAYIPLTTEGAELEASKRFVAFLNSEEGCEIQNKEMSPTGPFAISTCTLPDSVPTVAKDLQTWFDEGKTVPALEFLSPVKGPNLENITVEVGSGIRGAEDAAKLYDEDVKKQAQQLGLDGW
jgi:raffinose/stachyose/melibiose transport system substrate-binding protein